MISNLNLYKTYDLFKDNKDKEEIQFLMKYDISDRDIEIAQTCQKVRTMINRERNLDSIKKYDRGSKTPMVDFMSCITENTLSKIFVDKNAINTRNIKVNTPSVASYILDKSKEDFAMIKKDSILNFDLKSQYFQSSTSSLNINDESHARFCKNGSDFYIVALMRNKDNDYKNYENVESIYFFLLTKKYIEKHATMKFIKTPFYSIPTSDFIEVLKKYKQEKMAS